MKLSRAVAGVLGAIALVTSGVTLAQQKPIKIGFTMALTGGLAGAGKGALIAIEIWRDVIVHGRIEYAGATRAELSNNELVHKLYMGI